MKLRIIGSFLIKIAVGCLHKRRGEKKLVISLMGYSINI